MKNLAFTIFGQSIDVSKRIMVLRLHRDPKSHFKLVKYYWDDLILIKTASWVTHTATCNPSYLSSHLNSNMRVISLFYNVKLSSKTHSLLSVRCVFKQWQYFPSSGIFWRSKWMSNIVTALATFLYNAIYSFNAYRDSRLWDFCLGFKMKVK